MKCRRRAIPNIRSPPRWFLSISSTGRLFPVNSAGVTRTDSGPVTKERTAAMIWIVIGVVLGLALGVGVLLVLSRPVSIHSASKTLHKSGAGKATVSLKRVAPPRPVELSRDGPPRVDRPVDLPQEALMAAWSRQGGLCANCGRLLAWTHRGRDSGLGAWQSHHRTPRDQGGSSHLKNCVLLCSNMANCHFNIGHGGIA